MANKEAIEKIINCIKEIKSIINSRAELANSISLSDVLKDVVNPGEIDWNSYIKAPTTEETSTKASKNRPGYELVEKGKVKVYKKIKNRDDANKKQTTSKNRVKRRGGKPKNSDEFMNTSSQVAEEKNQKNEKNEKFNQTDVKQESLVMEVTDEADVGKIIINEQTCPNVSKLDQSRMDVNIKKNIIASDNIEYINTANRCIKNQKKLKEKENLVNALLNIKVSNIYVKCLVNHKNIQNQEAGITYYSEQLDQVYQIYFSDKPDAQAKNNLLLLLYKIGEFINTFDCCAKFNKALNNFKFRSMYKRLSRISKAVYNIWKPNTDLDLLKIGEFSLYWFDSLNQSDINEVRESIHRM